MVRRSLHVLAVLYGLLRGLEWTFGWYVRRDGSRVLP